MSDFTDARGFFLPLQPPLPRICKATPIAGSANADRGTNVPILGFGPREIQRGTDPIATIRTTVALSTRGEIGPTTSTLNRQATPFSDVSAKPNDLSTKVLRASQTGNQTPAEQDRCSEDSVATTAAVEAHFGHELPYSDLLTSQGSKFRPNSAERHPDRPATCGQFKPIITTDQ